MAWTVDTCVLIDVAEADAVFGIRSAQLLDRLRSDGLVISPVSYVELAPVFAGDESGQHEFLNHLSVSWKESWTNADTSEARQCWNQCVTARRAGAVPKRPLADVLIGAFACRFQGILTRNDADFRQLFPALKVILP